MNELEEVKKQLRYRKDRHLFKCKMFDVLSDAASDVAVIYIITSNSFNVVKSTNFIEHDYNGYTVRYYPDQDLTLYGDLGWWLEKDEKIINWIKEKKKDNN